MALQKESDDRGGAEHPRRDGGGCREPHALDRRDAWGSDFPAGDDEFKLDNSVLAPYVFPCRRDIWRLPAPGY